MSRPGKHNEENRAILERIQLFKGFPTGTWEERGPPEPEFHFTATESPVVGVELTRLYPLGEGLKEKESGEDDIVRMARETYASQDLPAVSVRVFWSQKFKPKKQGRRLIALQLANLVSQNVPPLGGEILLPRTLNEPRPDLPFGVDSIAVDRIVDYMFNCWGSSRAGFEPNLCSRDIQVVVEKKNGIYGGYQGPCSQLWLLIVVEGVSPSSFGIPTEEMRSHTYTGVFQRLFFATLLPPHVIELNMKCTPCVRQNY